MTLKNFISKNHEIVSCAPSTPATEVARLMEQHDVGSVVITKDDKPIGIVTDRDLALRVVAKALDLHTTKIEDVMTDPVQTVREDDSIFDISRVFHENSCRRVVVVDSNGVALAVFSTGDVFKLITEELHMLASVTAAKEEKLIRRTVA